MAKLDNQSYNVPRPPRNFRERMSLTKSQLSKDSVQWKENLKIIGGHIKTGANKAGTNAKSMTQKAKEKEIGQKMGSRLSMMFKRKR